LEAYDQARCLKPLLSLPVVDGVAMVGQPVEQRSSHFGIAEDARPFAGGELVVKITELRS
jgi:hypothetical protein